MHRSGSAFPSRGATRLIWVGRPGNRLGSRYTHDVRALKRATSTQLALLEILHHRVAEMVTHLLHIAVAA
jgi:hypothetical protein